MATKTWKQRCDEHPAHIGVVTHQMVMDRMQEEIDELRIQLAACQANPPEGFKLVPIEPTDEMIAAGDALMYDTIECAHNVFNAMLDAAPGNDKE